MILIFKYVKNLHSLYMSKQSSNCRRNLVVKITHIDTDSSLRYISRHKQWFTKVWLKNYQNTLEGQIIIFSHLWGNSQFKIFKDEKSCTLCI